MKKLLRNDMLQIYFGAFLWTIAGFIVLYNSNSLPGVDVYFHIRLSEIMKTNGVVLESFPWTTYSVWNNNFFDKDWLFHVYLIPFLSLGSITGAKTALLFLIFINGIAWGMLSKALKNKYIFLTLTLILLCSGYAFLGRLLLLRSHLFSIFFLAISLIYIVKKKRISLTILSILYCLTYTGSWQIIPIALIFDLVEILRNSYELSWDQKSKKYNIKDVFKYIPLQIKQHNFIFIWALLGILIGTLINPYYPNNISGGFLQNIMVLKNSWLGNSGTSIRMGDELYALSTIKIFTVYLPTIIIMISGIFYLINCRHNRLSYKLITFGLLSVGYFTLTLITQKFTDYFVPITIIFVALCVQNATILNKTFRIISASVIILILLFFGYYSICRLRKDTVRKYPEYSGATNWLNRNIEVKDNDIPNKTIFTANWSVTPLLFYGSPQFKYLVFLEPYFMYSYSPEKYKIWKNISEGKTLFPAIKIKREFNSDIVFLTKYNRKLFKTLSSSKFAKLKYQGPDGESIFILNVPNSLY